MDPDNSISDEEEDDDDVEIEQGEEMDDTGEGSPQVPRIRIPANLLKKTRRPRGKCLIVRLLGKTIGYTLLVNKMKKLWGLQADFETLDIGHGFFIFKFDMIEDYTRVFTGGPWVAMDHYVTIRKWQHDFKPDEAEEDTTAIWMRFPNLPIEYYSERILFHIAKAFGNPLKVDIKTAMAARGKYARVCVEMDLRKPLISHFTIGKYKYTVEYEHIHSFCFSCGRVGHWRKNSSERWPAPKRTSEPVTVGTDKGNRGSAATQNTQPRECADTSDWNQQRYGPWMRAQNRRRKPNRIHNHKTDPSPRGNKFQALQQDDVHPNDQEAHTRLVVENSEA
ncbi:hypothetical protein LOK49_LG11G02199 [Camellia lanceoleosa]|uniref:Uncharacterized protein n=1 Tax=Camellia lanceoleosa TaxID=1840588 RepID=A0ACC0G2B2_9ERIC|nr:hypothetical protein LOK49_LG11G02199 [Camellia lanceoleosa]